MDASEKASGLKKPLAEDVRLFHVLGSLCKRKYPPSSSMVKADAINGVFRSHIHASDGARKIATEAILHWYGGDHVPLNANTFGTEIDDCITWHKDHQ